ncbi:MAG: choice-of-anchor D domain-containing protein [Gemmatimonadetes bacterium]|nr:choice-of-anchor D domain-containing protein [Gemmatimonadota bacterium]
MTALGFPAYIELARSDIEVSPIVLDLGDVDVGLSAAQVVTVTNLGGADLVVTDIGFEGGVGSDFSISAAPALLATLLPDETADVEITFAPTALGAASAILQITSNDPDQGLVEVMLSGTGVVLDPSDALGTILVFFDQSVTDGTLVGSGPGGSGAMRLTALRNMLLAAGDLIDVGQAEIGVQPASRRLPTDGRSISATGFCGGHSGSRVGDANPRSPHIDGLRKNSYLKRIDAPLDAPKPSLKCWMELNEG